MGMLPLSENAIKEIVIVGGGSSGWMAAAAFAATLDDRHKITLIESEDIGTVGVGEATIPAIKLFNKKLGIDENEFIKHTGGSFKLGIQFVDWGEIGRSYFHPFGQYGRDFDVVPLHQYWLKLKAEGKVHELDEYSMAWWAASHGKFCHPSADRRLVQSTYDYAYHFDASSYATYLRAYSEKRGVRRIEGMVVDVTLNRSSGFIDAVTLADGQTISGDLFVDCTGFRAMLIGDALQTEFEDWSQWLRCDRAVAVASKRTEPLLSYTRSTALSAGWQWRIPLQHRTGNGYVYCHENISDDEACEVLLGNLDAAPISDPKILRFTAGRREKFWVKNCFGVGLSAGFMEPLESTSLHLIQSSITRFLALFPDKHCDPLLANEYNRITEQEYEGIRDFLILHYYATARRDSRFWRDCASMSIPDGLAYKMEHFRKFGNLVARDYELFQNPSWLAVLVGQMDDTVRYSPLVDARPQVYGQNLLQGLRSAMMQATEILPTHGQYIAANCPRK